MATKRQDSAGGRDSPPDAPRTRRRGRSRPVSLLHVAVLIRGESRRLCQVRELSADGLVARVFAEVVAGEPVAVELEPGRRIDGRVAWRRHGDAGIAFDHPIELDTASTARPQGSERRRRKRPHLALDRLAMIRAGTDISFASTREISRGGVSVVCDRPLPEGAEIVLTIEGFRPLAGVVLWHRDGCCGIGFSQVIPSGDLTRWLAS